MCTSGAVVGAEIAGRTVIGNHNTIGYHAVVGVKCQDMKYKVLFSPLYISNRGITLDYGCPCCWKKY